MATGMIFGTAGIPATSRKQETISGIERVKELGLEAMEMEFVHGVRMKKEQAEQVRKQAEKLGITLTVHSPYYINLNSLEEKKQAESRQRIIDSAVIGGIAGAKCACFHPGFFQGMEQKKVFETIKKQLLEIMEALEKEKNACAIKPETTGKPTQFGGIEELLEMHRQTGLQPYIDFAHLHARENGKFRKKDDVKKVFEKIEKTYSKLLKTLNAHMSGIRYGEKGEKNHLNLEEKENDFPYKWVLECMKEFSCKGTVICESPNIEKDALLMKQYWEKL